MSRSDPPDAQALLAPLRPGFIERCRGDLALLRRALDEGDVDDEDVQRLCHGLAGLAGVFGYAELAAEAVAVDQRFLAGQRPERAEIEAVVRRLEAIG